ncbi:MAG: tetratricopeptide (TPR) repeat protein [Porticoccus sp.]|jgi:tetratricopeptide (TPR) repeat protein
MTKKSDKPSIPPLPLQSIVQPNAAKQQQLTLAQAFDLAVAHQQNGNLAQAEQTLRQILQKNPKHAPSLHLLGVIAHQSNQTEQAIKFIADAIAINPTDALFHSNRGEMCRILGRLDGAIDHGLQAIKLNPQSASALSNLGIAYYDQEDLDKAERYQNKAIVIDPNCLPALNNLGSIYRDRKDKDKAIEYYRQVVAINPNYLESINNLGAVLVEQDEYEEARKTLLKALTLNPNYAEAHCNISHVFIGQEQYDQALAGFAKAISLKADYAEAYIGRSRVQQELNQLASAEASAKKAIELEPDNSDAHALLGGIYVESNQLDDAKIAFDLALTLDVENGRALVGLGTLKMQTGDINEAEQYFHQALTIDDKNITARISIAQARKVLADDENFLKLEEEIPNLDTMNQAKAMPIHFALGKCYEDLKMDEKAFSHFLKGCEIKRSKIDYDANSQHKNIQAIIDFFNPGMIDSLSGAGNPSTTPIFILGMPRSGTTLTEQIISSHSAVFGAGELPDLLQLANTPLDNGATVGFPGSIKNLTKEHLTALGDQYVAQVQAIAPEAKNITDKMPANFFCVGLIHLMLPNAKIIHIRRNPIDTCLSGFSKLFNNGQAHSYNLAELGRYYCNYDRMMKHWHKVIPSDNFMEIQYEDLVANTAQKTRELISFVNLEWDDVCLNFQDNKRAVRTASIAQVRKPIYQSSVAKWKRYEKHLGPLLIELGDLVPQD